MHKRLGLLPRAQPCQRGWPVFLRCFPRLGWHALATSCELSWPAVQTCQASPAVCTPRTTPSYALRAGCGRGSQAGAHLLLPAHASIASKLLSTTSTVRRSKALTAHLISPGVGASFSMLLADLKPGAVAGQAPASTER